MRLDSAGGLLVVFIVIGLPLAMYFRSKQGGEQNQYFGVIWALGIVAAIAWGASRRGTRRRAVDCVVALGIIGALVATALRVPRFDLRLPACSTRSPPPPACAHWRNGERCFTRCTPI